MDMQKIPPIHQKRIVTFVNHFIINTVCFLNTFSNTCENSLMVIERKMRKLDTVITILERKLDSIPILQETPELENQNENIVYDGFNNESKNVEDTRPDTPTQKQDDKSYDLPVEADVRIPSELDKYGRMCKVGVPVNAVKLKMKQDGYNPDLLDKFLPNIICNN